MIKLEPHGKTAVVRLDNKTANAVNLNLLEELAETLETVKNQYHAMVLAGNPRFFSMGFDLPELILLDRNGFSEFFQKFNETVISILTLPVPTVAALGGHTIAGGAILALACDFRVGKEGKPLIGLNEIKLGLPVPFIADLMLRQVTGDRTATRMIFQGEFVSMAEAAGSGLVDRVAENKGVEAGALEMAADLACLSGPAMEACKAIRTRDITRAYDAYGTLENERLIDCWQNPKTRELLKEAAEKF